MADEEYEIDVPAEAINIVDSQVVKCLPSGTTVNGITAHSSSLWTRTARIDALLSGKEVRYFLKATFGERGRKMVTGEFIAMSRMHEVSLALVPRPIAWGSYDSIADVYFFLCEFRDMETKLPDIETFSKMIAELHQNGISLNGKYGFDCTTYHGNVPIEHEWSDSWESYFTRTTRELLRMEQEVRGPNEEIIEISKPFFDKVVPRLLRPLESGRRSIKPTLIHGDLWHGNAAVDENTGRPIIFDAAGFYAHNEYELAVWRQPWNEIGEPYRVKYCDHFPPAQPREDFESRGLLYGTRVNLLDSILYKNDENYREMLIWCMRELVSRFPGGYEEWLDQQAGT